MDTNSTATRDELQVIDDNIRASEESILKLKYHRNTLAPISTLPPETLITIFLFLSPSTCDARKVDYLVWLWVTHVCHQWREIALKCPYLWNYIPFTKLLPAGIAELLARAKMMPLNLEAEVTNKTQFDAFGTFLKVHIPHTRRLSLSGQFPTKLHRLISFSPVLESLSLCNKVNQFSLSEPIIPLSLLKVTAPKLTYLRLVGCDINWKSPLFHGLRTLKIRGPSIEARPTLEDWLDALEEMPQLEALTLDSASPTVPDGNELIPDLRRTITLPFLTYFNIIASAKECTLALAHLILPVLTSLFVIATRDKSSSNNDNAPDILLLLPHVVRNAHGPQDKAPLRTIEIDACDAHVDMTAWTKPVTADNDDTGRVCDNSPRVFFDANATVWWDNGEDMKILDELLTCLPVNAISTLSVSKFTELSNTFWLRHVPRLVMLERVHLCSWSFGPFRQMLVKDVPPDGPPRLPRLKKLILHRLSLTTLRTRNLLYMLRKRMEQGVPLEALDLRTCKLAELAIQLLKKAVRNIQGPEETLMIGDPDTGTEDDDNTLDEVDFHGVDSDDSD